MAKYEIDFKHTVEESYTAIIEADSKDEALEMFDNDPFEYLIDEYPFDDQGLSIDVIEVREVK